VPFFTNSSILDDDNDHPDKYRVIGKCVPRMSSTNGPYPNTVAKPDRDSGCQL